MKLVGQQKPELLLTETHHMCPGCGEPLALRGYLEAIQELGLSQRAIAVAGIGCYTSFSMTTDVDLVQALHGRAPSVATGVKRMLPDAIVFTVQGDGDMVNEGLQEVLHTAARGEAVTCILLNNGVFGETGGHMTATSVIGQRTKNTLDGRDAGYHGYPILIGDLLARLEGAAYVARGSVHNAGAVARTAWCPGLTARRTPSLVQWPQRGSAVNLPENNAATGWSRRRDTSGCYHGRTVWLRPSKLLPLKSESFRKPARKLSSRMAVSTSCTPAISTCCTAPGGWAMLSSSQSIQTLPSAA